MLYKLGFFVAFCDLVITRNSFALGEKMLEYYQNSSNENESDPVDKRVFLKMTLQLEFFVVSENSLINKENMESNALMILISLLSQISEK